MELEYITHREEDTIKIASDFASQVRPRDVIFLEGELGSGKTTFVKGIAQAIGVEGRVLSPTFPIVRIHRAVHPTISSLYHLDLYRMTGSKVDTIGIQDMIDDGNGIMLIEWPNYTPIPLKPTYRIFFQTRDDESHHIVIKDTSETTSERNE